MAGMLYAGKAGEAACRCCGRTETDISKALGVCRDCVVAGGDLVDELLWESRQAARAGYSTPAFPPRGDGGALCRMCANRCRIAPGGLGFCGLRENRGGRLHHLAGTSRAGVFTAYHDALPTNCVADWVCPGSSGAGYPDYSYARGAERSYKNLAVFLAACSFDCLFCQNWTFRLNTEELAPLRPPEALAAMVDKRTSCVCYFGGDPAPQMPFALAASRLALKRASGRILRVCWETNGSMHPGLLKKALSMSLQTGGCIKFDLKAFEPRLHQALTGASNARTLENLRLAVELSAGRKDPPPVVVSTLMVPGYVGAEEVARIARFLASLDKDIPYSLLAFHPCYLMEDMGTTGKEWAAECLRAAEGEGLTRIKLGNVHLLS